MGSEKRSLLTVISPSTDSKRSRAENRSHGLIEAILFDCDGVILDSEDTWSLFDPELTKPLITGLGAMDSLRLLRDQYGFAGELETLARERSEIIREMFAREVRLTAGFPEFRMVKWLAWNERRWPCPRTQRPT